MKTKCFQYLSHITGGVFGLCAINAAYLSDRNPPPRTAATSQETQIAVARGHSPSCVQKPLCFGLVKWSPVQEGQS